MQNNGWIGVDLDGTLSEYHGEQTHIGKPIWPMVERVKSLLAAGKEVRIFTVRVGPDGWDPVGMAKRDIRDWLQKEAGLPVLEVTATKDCGMIKLYDDRAIQVEVNTGRIVVERMVELLAKVVEIYETDWTDDSPEFDRLIEEIRGELKNQQ